MRLNGKPRQVVNPITGNTVWSQYPVTREEAYIEDVVKYWPMTLCPVHGDPSVVFTLTNIPACCAHHGAAAAYNEARMNGEPTTLSQAKEQGIDYYYIPQAHPRCGHPGKITLGNKCWFCEEEKRTAPRSPRQQALAAGKAWYMPTPDDPCPHGHVAERRVTNGSCRECEAKRKGYDGRSNENAINKICPDLVISRADAHTMGFKVYRTGEPCHQGHRGWRYVSTMGCLDCLRGVLPVK